MAASSKDKRTPITTPPYQVPSADVTPDPPTFSLDTTFKIGVPYYMFTEQHGTVQYTRKCIKTPLKSLLSYIPQTTL
jgi:hypothetical protein